VNKCFYSILTIIVLLFVIPSSTSISRDLAPLEQPEPEVEALPNSCFLSAILLKEKFQKYGIWLRIVHVLFTLKSEGDKNIHGHSFVEYVYPINSTNLWLYDNTGSWRINYDLKDNSDELAKKVFEDSKDDFKIIKSGFFNEN